MLVSPLQKLKRKLPTLIKVGVILILVNMIAHFLPFDAYQREINFKTRNFLEQAPTLDPRIKIYALDDRGVTKLGTNELSIEQWAALLKNIDSRKPAAIFITKFFTLVRKESEATAKAAIKELEKLDTPIVTMAFTVF